MEANHHDAGDAVRRLILDKDWTEADLREAARILDHIESSPADLEALRDYDRLRTALRPGDADNRAQPVGGWSAFRDRVAGACGSPQPRIRSWGPPAAAAAVLAVAAAVWLTVGGGRRADVDASRVANSTPVERAAPQQPRSDEQSAELFEQVSAVFDGRASWVAVTEDDSQLGLAAEPVADAEKLLLLRLTVTRRGHVVSQVDVAILPGQSAELAVPFNGADSLLYNIDASADSPSTLAIWARLDNGSGDCRTLAALMTQLRTLTEPGRVAGQLVSRHEDYQFTVDFSQAALRGARR